MLVKISTPTSPLKINQDETKTRSFPRNIMGKIAKIEYFRVPPRWLFVKITDEDGNYGWGEASLEGHTQAVEGCLDAWGERYTGFEAE